MIEMILKSIFPYEAVYRAGPKKTPADTGYGSYDTYSYCKENSTVYEVFRIV